MQNPNKKDKWEKLKRFEHGLTSAILIREYIGYSCLMVFDNLGPEPLGLID
jgi:hypothetical protein